MIDRIDNPFQPGFGAQPPLLAGRRDVEDRITTMLERLSRGYAEPPLLLEGYRGMGKTTLLHRAAALAGGMGWHAIHLEASSNGTVHVDLVAALTDLLTDLAGQPPTWVARQVTAHAGVPGVASVDVALDRGQPQEPAGIPPARRLASSTITALLQAPSPTGVLIAIDEALLCRRPALDYLASFAQAVQSATPSAPVAILLAGVPGTYEHLTEVTYLERLPRIQVGMLDPSATWAALAQPVEEAGAQIDPEAAEHLVDRAGGYPYAIQLYGHHAWDAAHGQPAIDLGAAHRGTADARTQLDGLFAARWHKLGALERNFLGAVALLEKAGQPLVGAEAARLLGRTPSQLTATRADLVRKGLLATDGRQNAWALPGYGAFVLEQLEAEGISSAEDLRAVEAERRADRGR